MPFTHVSGLILADDFERPLGTTIGGNWIERSGNWELVNPVNQTVMVSNNQLVSNRYLENDTDTTTTTFLQSVLRHTHSDQFPAIVGRFDWNGGSWNGYELQIGPTGNGKALVKKTNGVQSAIHVPGGNTDPLRDYIVQLYLEDSLQEGWLNTGVQPNLGPQPNTTLNTFTGADTTHNGTDRTVALRHGYSLLTGQGAARWDDFIWTIGKTITVNGIPSGYTAELVNSSNTVLLTFTSATTVIDASRYTGTMAEWCPITGWPKLRVKDGGGSVIEEYTAAGIYPGDVLTWTPPAMGFPFIGIAAMGINSQTAHTWVS